MGIARRPDETDEEYQTRHRKYHRDWRRKYLARKREERPAEEEHVVSVVIPERVLKERDTAIQFGYRSDFAEFLGEPLIRRSALNAIRILGRRVSLPLTVQPNPQPGAGD